MRRPAWLSLCVSLTALYACGEEDAAVVEQPDPSESCVESTNVAVDLTAVSDFDEIADAEGEGTLTSDPFKIGAGADQRFIVSSPCDGQLTLTMNRGAGQENVPADWAWVVSYADTGIALDVSPDDPERAQRFSTTGTIDVTAADSPYVVFVPSVEPACMTYQITATLACAPDILPEDCENEVDDDGDGATDCADTECDPLDLCHLNECPAELDDELEDNDTATSATIIDLRDEAGEFGFSEWNGRSLRLRYNDDPDDDREFYSDEDWYIVELCPGGRVTMELTGVQPELEQEMVFELKHTERLRESTSFVPSRQEPTRVFDFRLDDREPDPLAIRVRHPPELGLCGEYDLDVSLTCGACFGLNPLDGEDLGEPNSGCSTATEVAPGTTFEASLRNGWPSNVEQMDQYSKDDDWYSVPVCPGGTLSVAIDVPEGVEPDYSMYVYFEEDSICQVTDPANDFIEVIDGISGSYTKDISLETIERESNVWIRLVAPDRGVCMRYDFTPTLACP